MHTDLCHCMRALLPRRLLVRRVPQGAPRVAHDHGPVAMHRLCIVISHRTDEPALGATIRRIPTWDGGVPRCPNMPPAAACEERRACAYRAQARDGEEGRQRQRLRADYLCSTRKHTHTRTRCEDGRVGRVQQRCGLCVEQMSRYYSVAEQTPPQSPRRPPPGAPRSARSRRAAHRATRCEAADSFRVQTAVRAIRGGPAPRPVMPSARHLLFWLARCAA